MVCVVGITGSLASGKTFACDILRALGYRVFDADLEVKRLYENEQIRGKVLELFPEMLDVDKLYIAKQIYTSEEKRKALHSIFHPIIGNKLASFIEKSEKQNYVFAEVPLLYEEDFIIYFDYVICAFAKDQQRRARFNKKFNHPISDKIFELIEKVQLPQLKKVALSDFTVYTDNTKCDITKQLKKIIECIDVYRNCIRPGDYGS